MPFTNSPDIYTAVISFFNQAGIYGLLLGLFLGLCAIPVRFMLPKCMKD